MNTTQAIRARRSIRKYQHDVVIPQEHIDLMLEAAMCAPSACNSRPWEFVVVENADMRQNITRVQPYCKALVDASIGIVVCGAPQALPDAPPEGFWPQDCAAAAENILLQATELGYGSCWCGIYPDRKCADAIASLLNVQTTPLSLIIVGMADEAPKQRGYLDTARVRYVR